MDTLEDNQNTTMNTTINGQQENGNADDDYEGGYDNEDGVIDDRSNKIRARINNVPLALGSKSFNFKQ